ncbi:SWIM zinc finger family protein [Paraburkholderia sacchari]|uniref:SWIM zinc finger family protein n=1 Tax=Paraburkholderia sacchari TaxID=159450 RepID=UPI001BCEDF7C|nr:SWIM zinc finger family protein [Paraburkholderia sacchari]
MADYGGWKPYVPVAERRKKAEQLVARSLKAGKNLSPVAPYRGAIAKTFWGKAWCDNLEHYSDYASRLPRGRTYVRNGSVIDLQISTGRIRAQVMGSSLYEIEIDVTACPEKQWRALSAECAASVDSMVELLQGKLSAAVMGRICKPGSGLFPAPKDIKLSCSCLDWAAMCKHVAAVLYGIGARLDQQPELLFTLRGVDPADLVRSTGANLSGAGTVPTSGKVLDNANLGDVFGIDIDMELLADPPRVRGKRTRKAVSSQAVVVATPKSTTPKSTTPKSMTPKSMTPKSSATAKSAPAGKVEGKVESKAKAKVAAPDVKPRPAAPKNEKRKPGSGASQATGPAASQKPTARAAPATARSVKRRG